MAQVRCEVSEGLRASEATVMVRDYHGAKHYLPVDRGMINEEKGTTYLPVGLLFVDEKKKAALVELPLEADSGVSRVWVKREQVLETSEARP